MEVPAYRAEVFRAAVEEQARLKGALVRCPLPNPVRFVAGTDVSSARFGRSFWGAVVVCDMEEGLAPMDRATARVESDFPYLPGLLAFREVPALAAAFARLRVRPEVLLCDAQGTAHPRGFGAAAHLGVVLDIPSVGCAKSRLCGEYEEPGDERGAWSPLALKGEVVGAALRTRAGANPLFVSPGHRCDLESALALVLACTPRFRLPEPARLAHQLSNTARRGEIPI